MSIHINAKKGDIAETVLLPGDPLRAKWIADTFLDDVVCYNEVRGMYGYTGILQYVTYRVREIQHVCHTAGTDNNQYCYLCIVLYVTSTNTTSKHTFQEGWSKNRDQ